MNTFSLKWQKNYYLILRITIKNLRYKLDIKERVLPCHFHSCSLWAYEKIRKSSIGITGEVVNSPYSCTFNKLCSKSNVMIILV